MQLPNENSGSLRDILEGLPTEKLDQMILSELEKEVPDKASIQLLMEILEEREDAQPPEPPTEQELAAWQRYKRKMEALRPVNKTYWPRWIYLAASVCIAAVLLFTGFAVSTRANPQLQMSAFWNEDTLEIVGPEGPDSEFVEYQFHTENPGLQQIYDQVVEMGVDLPVVPMWLPEGYEMVQCKARETSNLTGVYAALSDGKDQITYKIDVYDEEVSHEYQRNDVEYTFFEAAGILHSITKNNNRWIVVWTRNDNIECFLTIDCSEDILYKIIRSIYVWEDL